MEENIFNTVFNTEMGRKMLALVKAGFKVADLIPDLVLREKIKSQILVVYKKFIEHNHSELLKELDVLDHYFYLGGHLNLVKEEHIKQLQNGFLVFKSHIILTLHNHGEVEDTVSDALDEETDNDLTKKQKKILEKFESKDTLRLAEILEIFPGVSERTIRNELTSLIELGNITRNGKGNGSLYKLLK